MAKSLKQHSLIARDVIKRDVKILEETTVVADDNISDVEKETNRLKGKNQGCSWGLWILLIIVVVVFIQMILFIKMFPKRL
jgi:SNARE protein 1